MTPCRKKKPLPPPKLSDAEWDVMNVVWERAPVCASDVHDALDSKREWSPRTVKTLLARLVQKGAAEFEIDGKRYLYRPRVPRSDCLRSEGRKFLERVLGGSASPLLAYFVREGRLSAEEIAELRRLLDEEEERR